MKIYCHDLQRFLNVISGLVERGIQFEAHTSDLSITCTGGF